MAPHFACFGGGKSHRRRSSPEATTSSATADLTAEEKRRLSPVLLELFSSQGCATSPEAEAIATRLTRPDSDSEADKLPPVVVLSFHVDYWDYNGWKDPFAASAWTVRQKAYVEALRLDTLFTPQVVVGGKVDCVGTDFDKVMDAVRSASRSVLPAMQVTYQKPTPETLIATFNGKLNNKIEGSADIFIAFYENGLVTDVATGENKGRVLPNDHVVRKLEKMMNLVDQPAKKAVSGSVQVDLWPGFNPVKTGVLLFVQNSELQVLGVQQFQLPETI